MTNFESELVDYSSETQAFQAEQFDWGSEAEWNGQAEWGEEAEVFSEADLMELAAELLDVTSEAELDQFLGNLLKKAGRTLGKVVRSPIGRAVGGFLKGAAKRALPLAGAALGGYVGGPLGAKIGSGLASTAGGALGLEAEALNNDDREFEGAKTFVRMAGNAVKSAVSSPANANPTAVAKSAVTAAVTKFAPALLGSGAGSMRKQGQGGRWVRQGRNIIIVNAQPDKG